MPRKPTLKKFEANLPADLVHRIRDWRQEHGNCSNQEIAEAMARLFLSVPPWLQVLARSGSGGEVLIDEVFGRLELSIRITSSSDERREVEDLIGGSGLFSDAPAITQETARHVIRLIDRVLVKTPEDITAYAELERVAHLSDDEIALRAAEAALPEQSKPQRRKTGSD